MTFNVHLTQFDVAPTRNLIIYRCKNCKMCDVTLGGGLRNVTTCDKGGRGKKNLEIRVT